MAKLATPDKSLTAFLGDLLFVTLMWAAASTGIGWFIGSEHGGIVLLFGAWLVGIVFWLIHLFVLLRRWRAAPAADESRDAKAADA